MLTRFFAGSVVVLANPISFSLNLLRLLSCATSFSKPDRRSCWPVTVGRQDVTMKLIVPFAFFDLK